MTKKDYIRFAKIIKDNTNMSGYKIILNKDSFINDLCDVLKKDNIIFDRLRFIEACE